MAFGGPTALALLLVAARVIPADRPAPVPGDTARVPLARSGLSAIRSVWRAALGGAVLNGAFWGFLLIATFELQQPRSLSPLGAGLLLLPASVPLILSSRYAPRLSARFGTGWLILGGSIAAAAAYLLFSRTDQSLAGLLCTVLLIGLAFALSFPALNAEAVAGVGPAERGVVGGLFQTAVQLGGILMLVAVAWADPAAHRPAATVVAGAAVVGVVVAVAGFSSTRTLLPKE
jgi:predicted MFS family arabinose efflux permease